MDRGGGELPHRHTGDLRELDGVPADLTDEERATIDALKTESDQIEANYQDAEELPDEVYRESPGLRDYRYIHRENRTYVVEPRERRIIEEID